MRLLSFVAALAAVTACAAHSPEDKPVPADATTAAPAAPAAAGIAKPALGAFGVDLSAGNPAVKPGDDFFAYANGRWYDGFAIPADKSSFGAFDRLDELSKERVRGIIEAAAAAHAPAGTPEQQIGDYYAAFMDEAAIEANGLTPAQRGPGAHRRRAQPRTTSRACSASRASRRCSTCSCRADFKNPDRYAVFISQSDARPAGPRLLPEGRSAAEGAARQVRRLHRADADARRGGAGTGAGEGARHHGVRDRGREGAVADREAPRHAGDLQPAHQAAAARVRARLPVAGVPRAAAARRPPGPGAGRAHRHARPGRRCSSARRCRRCATSSPSTT